jgi:hypothetical protein
MGPLVLLSSVLADRLSVFAMSPPELTLHQISLVATTRIFSVRALPVVLLLSTLCFRFIPCLRVRERICAAHMCVGEILLVIFNPGDAFAGRARGRLRRCCKVWSKTLWPWVTWIRAERSGTSCRWVDSVVKVSVFRRGPFFGVSLNTRGI